MHSRVLSIQLLPSLVACHAWSQISYVAQPCSHFSPSHRHAEHKNSLSRGQPASLFVASCTLYYYTRAKPTALSLPLQPMLILPATTPLKAFTVPFAGWIVIVRAIGPWTVQQSVRQLCIQERHVHLYSVIFGKPNNICIRIRSTERFRDLFVVSTNLVDTRLSSYHNQLGAYSSFETLHIR